MRASLPSGPMNSGQREYHPAVTVHHGWHWLPNQRLTSDSPQNGLSINRGLQRCQDVIVRPWRQYPDGSNTVFRMPEERERPEPSQEVNAQMVVAETWAGSPV